MAARVIAFFTESWALKLSALGLAILLWMGVRASQPERATFPGIPVEVDLRDPAWQLAGPPEPAVVRVTVLGPAGELLSLAGDPPRIVLPVERVSDSLERQVLPLQWVQLPTSVRDARVLGLQPDTILLRYERLVARTLPLRVRTTGSLAAGYELAGPINTNPAVLTARGPERFIQGLDSVPLLPVDLSGLRSTTNVPTRVDTSALDGVVVEAREVNVVIRVAMSDSLAEALGDSARPRPPF